MKIIAFILLLYWCVGMLCLPMGDFAAIKDLPQQYNHCKETEDKDMTLVDFVTDHLLNIDCVFDNHENGDEQKPHSPVTSNQHSLPFTIIISQKNYLITKRPIFITANTSFGRFKDNNYQFTFISSVFHPPTV